MSRVIDTAFIHFTNTLNTASVESIKNYWFNTLGWSSPGYHILIEPDGTSIQLLDFNEVANGVYGHNQNSIHICYIGGRKVYNKEEVQVHNMTIEQEQELICRLIEWKDMFGVDIKGHNEVSNRACPGFDVQEFRRKINV